jgi:ribonucleoside-diphosphate reductase alpha chain
MDKETTLKEWLGDSQLGTDIINKKYLQENETFMEWAERVSGGNQEVKRLFIEQKFIPAGRILSNRGLNNKGIKSTLSNCYVLTVDDSIESIYQCCSNMARTYSYGGGVGIDISKLRPSGAIVHNSARSTTGAVSFMKTFDVVTGTIGQNGRRGALMISLSVNHPDVLEFVDIKANTDQITNANISIRVNDKFMKAVENDTDYLLHWPCEMDISDKEIDAVEDYNQLTCVETISGPVYLKKIKARDLFMKLAKNNWDYGEPGILYWDRIKNWHMMSANSEFEYAGVNPCAEEPLPNGGACLLGAMNLYKYVNDNGEFMFDEFKKDVKIATVGLNQIQVEGTELHPLEVQRENAKKYRQIGLGIFDLGGALIKMGVTYGTPESRKIAYNITHEMLISAFEQSCDLNTAGVEYPGLFNSDFYKKQIEPYIGKQYKGRYPLNSQLLTIAPTGTTSTMVNATAGGGEPMFAKLYTRSTKSIGEVDYVVYPQAVLDYLGKDFDKNNLNVDYINENMNKLPDYFVSADIIEPKDRILMQAALQENIDASISSTINLPEKATVQDVYDIYLQAWSNGLKGVTVFREGCKRAAILNRTTEKKESEVIFNTVNAPKRPKVLDGDYYQVKVQGKTFIIIVGLMDGKPYEMFVLPCDECQKVKNHRGKITRVKKRVYKFESEIMEIPNIAIEVDNDYDINGEIEKISSIVNEGHKLSKGDVEIIRDSVYNIKEYSEKREYRNVSIHVSGNLRTGMRLEDIIKLEDKCNDSIVSFNKAVARVLSKYMPNEEETGDTCPECGAALVREEGCIHCPKCGWSRCS